MRGGAAVHYDVVLAWLVLALTTRMAMEHGPPHARAVSVYQIPSPEPGAGSRTKDGRAEEYLPPFCDGRYM